jgi:LysR family transcriptional regulator, hydrogen peroxide-inducible genes activator
MNLNHLQFASALATAGSFTSAARQCHVTQPTLSNGVAQLEDELGERLFTRTTRAVGLTPFGEHILPYINEVLRAHSAVSQQAKAFQSPEKRLIRIGTSPLMNAKRLGLMIEPFTRHHADVEVVLREMNMTDLYRMRESGMLDFVFGVADADKKKGAAAFLYEEPLRFIPRGGVWQGGARPLSVRFQDIADDTYVMVPDACGLSRATRNLFRSHRRQLHAYSGEAMSYQVLEEWAALGIGSAILPRSKIVGDTHDSFPIADKSGHEVTIAFEATWLPVRSKSPHLQEFTKHLRSVVPKLLAGAEMK